MAHTFEYHYTAAYEYAKQHGKRFTTITPLDDLAPRLQTPKSELIAEIEARLTGILGVEVGELFRAVAERQHHTASSLNLDRAHKSALVLIAHVLAKVEGR